MSFEGKCMELEIIMLSEISQAQKDKNCMFSSCKKKLILVLHDCKTGTVRGGEPADWKREKEVSYIYV
jgi:hypothetical protein